MKSLFILLATLLSSHANASNNQWCHLILNASDRTTIQVDYQIQSVGHDLYDARPIWFNVNGPSSAAQVNVNMSASYFDSSNSMSTPMPDRWVNKSFPMKFENGRFTTTVPGGVILQMGTKRGLYGIQIMLDQYRFLSDRISGTSVFRVDFLSPAAMETCVQH